MTGCSVRPFLFRYKVGRLIVSFHWKVCTMSSVPTDFDRPPALCDEALRPGDQEIKRLQIELDALRIELQTKSIQLERLDQIRKVNQNLVIAAIDAQTTEAKALADNLRQEEFLLMLAHELRNPLAPIGLANELIGKLAYAHPDLPALQAIVTRQFSHISRLVDDLLDASRISAGKITLHRATVRLTDVIAMALETSQPGFIRRHQKAVVQHIADTILIDGDLNRLAQVFSNLLINASKFTPEQGDISIAVSQVGDIVRIAVKDSGIGIPLHQQEDIFNLFVQGFKSFSRPQGGLGIGLSLARTIVEMHHGSIAVISAGAGRGSEFVVQLPMARHRLPLVSAAPAAALAQRPQKILLIEDNVDTNTVLRNLLQLEGHRVVSAYDGAEGLAQAGRELFDIVICDIGLPDMSGYDLVGKLPQPVPLLIALSGYNPRAHTQPGRRFDYYLVKPIRYQSLHDAISAHAVAANDGAS